jgi:hypothetical protein
VETIAMQHSSPFPKFDSRLALVALGSALFMLIVAAIAQPPIALADFSEGVQRLVAFVDVQVAALISAASLLVFSGLWRAAPATRIGRYGLRTAVLSLVLVNWAAWVVALWWH